MSNTLGVRHVGIVVADIEVSKKFYESLGFVAESECRLENGSSISNLLGFENVSILTLKMLLNENDTSLWREGGFRLELIQYLAPVSLAFEPEKNNIVGKVHLSFTVSDLDFSISEIVRLGGSVPFPSVKTSDERNFIIYAIDPNGIPLELITHKT